MEKKVDSKENKDEEEDETSSFLLTRRKQQSKRNKNEITTTTKENKKELQKEETSFTSSFTQNKPVLPISHQQQKEKVIQHQHSSPPLLPPPPSPPVPPPPTPSLSSVSPIKKVILFKGIQKNQENEQKVQENTSKILALEEVIDNLKGKIEAVSSVSFRTKELLSKTLHPDFFKKENFWWMEMVQEIDQQKITQNKLQHEIDGIKKEITELNYLIQRIDFGKKETDNVINTKLEYIENEIKELKVLFHQRDKETTKTVQNNNIQDQSCIFLPSPPTAIVVQQTKRISSKTMLSDNETEESVWGAAPVNPSSSSSSSSYSTATPTATATTTTLKEPTLAASYDVLQLKNDLRIEIHNEIAIVMKKVEDYFLTHMKPSANTNPQSFTTDSLQNNGYKEKRSSTSTSTSLVKSQPTSKNSKNLFSLF